MSCRSIVFVLSALFLSTNFAARAQRLPAGIRPEHYRLTLTPDLKAATFSGEETIDLILDAPSRSVTLNAAEINFGTVNANRLPDTTTDYGKLGSQPMP